LLQRHLLLGPRQVVTDVRRAPIRLPMTNHNQPLFGSPSLVLTGPHPGHNGLDSDRTLLAVLDGERLPAIRRLGGGPWVRPSKGHLAPTGLLTRPSRRPTPVQVPHLRVAGHIQPMGRIPGTPYLIVRRLGLGPALGGSYQASEEALDSLQKRRLAQTRP
jgi:hypothetical protein